MLLAYSAWNLLSVAGGVIALVLAISSASAVGILRSTNSALKDNAEAEKEHSKRLENTLLERDTIIAELRSRIDTLERDLAELRGKTDLTKILEQQHAFHEIKMEAMHAIAKNSTEQLMRETTARIDLMESSISGVITSLVQHDERVRAVLDQLLDHLQK